MIKQKAICLFNSLLFENDLCLCQLPQMQNHFYRITFVFSEASGKTMVFIIFRRRDHYPELCSRHGARLHENKRCFLHVFHAKEASEGARRARWVKALHARFVFRSPEKRGKIGLLF